jgi:hypothetical protein
MYDGYVMTTEHIASFAEFWPQYIRDHQNPVLRTLHVVGTTLTLAGFAAAIVTRRPLLIPVVAVAAFGAARLSHIVIEGKPPAMQGHLLWAIRGDLMMWLHTLKGTMRDELARHTASDTTSDGNQMPA